MRSGPPVAAPATAADPGEPAPRFLRDGRSALEIEAVLHAPALLVVNDTMLDGWTATVDGAAAPIVEVNGLVRGVWLDAGTHRVAMRYVPPGLVSGVAISCAALLVTGLMAWVSRRRLLRGVRVGDRAEPLLVRAGR